MSEELFKSVLIRERKRADRSNEPLGLVLVSVSERAASDAALVWPAVTATLSAIRRETDVMGWFKKSESVGLILPDVPAGPSFARELNDRIRGELSQQLDAESGRSVSVRVWMQPGPEALARPDRQPLDPSVERSHLRSWPRTRYDAVKRVLDLMLSAAMLLTFAPVFLIIAVLVKLTSPGPVLFRQERVGQMMKPFIMLKFRTMQVNADPAVHFAFISSFIKSEPVASASNSGLFKIANDSRVTPIGRILRRTSLDELPQLWNVLRGDMSLVGPRPPLKYEVEQYQPWHRRRILEAKPGLTGLWQVIGRSCTTFDEMVRLDLRYARTYSAWMDLKILLATPRAVISGKGAC